MHPGENGDSALRFGRWQRLTGLWGRENLPRFSRIESLMGDCSHGSSPLLHGRIMQDGWKGLASVLAGAPRMQACPPSPRMVHALDQGFWHPCTFGH